MHRADRQGDREDLERDCAAIYNIYIVYLYVNKILKPAGSNVYREQYYCR